jgi:hypothetical protein
MADKDTSFYSIVVIMAVIILIVALVFIALQIEDNVDNKSYPPVQTKCPDYWDSYGTNCKIPPFGSEHPNTGSIREGENLILDPSNTPGLDFGDDSIDMADSGWSSDTTSLCGKKKWANLYNIEWDGVSNYNDCSKV